MKPTLIEPDLFAVAWAAQARWLWERTEESGRTADRAILAYLAAIDRKRITQKELK